MENVIEYLTGISNLGIEKLKASKRFKPGRKGKFLAFIRNNEPSYSGESKVSFYLSKDKRISKKDIFLGKLDVPQIKGSGKKKIKLVLNLPDNIKPGTYYFLAQLNPDGYPKETVAENNFLALEVTVH